MKIIFATSLVLLSFATFASSEGEHCLYEGKIVNVGDSVWIVDPVLVSQARQTMKSEGYTDQQIEKEISRNDWVGFRLECVITFHSEATGSVNQPGDIIKPMGVALVLNRYSKDYYAHLKEQSQASAVHPLRR